MRHAMAALVLLILAACVAATLTDNPEQIHISYGDTPDSMHVTWATGIKTATTLVRYGQDVTLNQSASGTCTEFVDGNLLGLHWIHKVKITGLTPGATYFYRAVSGASSSTPYSFTAMRSDPSWVPKLIVYGDLGHDGGGPSLARIKQEVATGQVDAVIHAGDFAYDMDTKLGMNGDDFLNYIQPIAASVPYQTCIGNHEQAYNMSHYRNRFFMGGNSENLWYSWDMGQIHFVAYSTEVFFMNGTDPRRMIQWLESDLTAANKNRAQRPWIVAFGHRPMYCSNSDGDECTTPGSFVRLALEEMFYRQGVDVIIEAHEHSYERLWPVYNMTVTQQNYVNPQAPVHIISGAAGCNELYGICENPIIKAGGPWSAFRAWFLAYGYGHMYAPNATHLYWNEVLDLDGSILDEIWIEQHAHGPFV